MTGPSLRAQAMSGGRQLAAREAVGIVIRTVGVLVVVRLIGPAEYGLFAGPLFIVVVGTVLATAGLDIFLIRQHGTVDQRWYHQAFTFLLVSSLSLAGAIALAAELLEPLAGSARAVLALQILLLSIPLNILWIPGRAMLEREFSYRRLGIGEVSADVAQYAVAIALAVAGAGMWAAVVGYLLRHAVMLVVCTAAAGYRPGLVWDPALLRRMLGFGAPLSAGILARRAADLVVPIVVGRYAGAAGVGVVALSLRLTETASFLSRAINRLSIVALGRLQMDLPRLRQAVEEGTALQVLLIGGVLAVFSNVVAFLLPVLLGPSWEAVGDIVPVLALAQLVAALLTTQNTALMVLGRRWTIVVANVAALLLTFLAALLLVPPFGLMGYAVAQLVALTAMFLKNLELRRMTGVTYRRARPWLVATAPLVTLPLLPPWIWPAALAIPLIVVLLPAPRRELRGYVTGVRRTRHLAQAPVEIGPSPSGASSDPASKEDGPRGPQTAV